MEHTGFTSISKHPVLQSTLLYKVGSLSSSPPTCPESSGSVSAIPQIRTWTVKLYCVLSVAHGRVNQGEREVTTEHINFPSLGLQPRRLMFSVLVVIVEAKSSKEVTSHPLRSLSLPSGGILAYHSSNGHSLLC